MSWRTWLGDDKQDWADFNVRDYAVPVMDNLCREVAWKLPAKVYAPPDHWASMWMFLRIMHDSYHMPPEEFWVVAVGDEKREHPTWEDLAAWTSKLSYRGFREEPVTEPVTGEGSQAVRFAQAVLARFAKGEKKV